MIDRRTFLAGAAWCAAAGILRAQMNGTAPPGPSGLVRIKADRPTLLMGDEAAITGGAKPQIVDHGAKRLQVGNWTSADDSFTWQVDVPASGEFIVTALTKSKGAVLKLKAGIVHGVVPSVNLEIYQDIGVGEALLDYTQAIQGG